MTNPSQPNLDWLDDILIPLLQNHLDLVGKKKLQLQPNYTAKSLTEAKTAIATKLQHLQDTIDNISLVANANIPAEWVDSVTGNRLYNQTSLRQVELEARIKRVKQSKSLCGCNMCEHHSTVYTLNQRGHKGEDNEQ